MAYEDAVQLPNGAWFDITAFRLRVLQLNATNPAVPQDGRIKLANGQTHDVELMVARLGLADGMPALSTPDSLHGIRLPNGNVYDAQDLNRRLVARDGGQSCFLSRIGATLTARPDDVKLKLTPGGFVAGDDGVPVITPYIGQVATRTFVPTSQDPVSAKQLYARNVHYAGTNMTTVAALLANWWVGAQNNPKDGSEAASGGSMTTTFSIEDTAGNITQFTFGGATSGVIGSGLDRLTDYVTLRQPILKGSKFYSRVWQSCPSGVIFSTPNIPHAEDQIAYGTTTPDLTMGGTAGAGQGGVGYGPVAIVGLTTAPSVFIGGDSEQRGQADTVDATGDVGGIARALGLAGIPYINAAAGSDTVGNASANGCAKYAKRGAAARFCSHAILAYGNNDFFLNNALNAAVKTNVETLTAFVAARVQTGKVGLATLTPVANSDGSVNTTVNPKRTTHNDYIRNNQMAGMWRAFEVADPVESARNSGQWKANFSTDGLHGLQAAKLAIRNSGNIPGSAFAYP